jgi:hypothetical protein
MLLLERRSLDPHPDRADLDWRLPPTAEHSFSDAAFGVAAPPESIPEEDARVKTAFLLLTTAWLAGADVEPAAEPVAAPKTAQTPPAPPAVAPVVAAPVVEEAPFYEEHASKPGFFARLKEKFNHKPKHVEAPACDCGSSAPLLTPAPTVLPAAPAPEKAAPEKLPAGDKEKTEAPELKGAPVEANTDVPF